jgi:hypothetical protein
MRSLPNAFMPRRSATYFVPCRLQRLDIERSIVECCDIDVLECMRRDLVPPGISWKSGIGAMREAVARRKSVEVGNLMNVIDARATLFDSRFSPMLRSTVLRAK